jgi:hypothetical protein
MAEKLDHSIGPRAEIKILGNVSDVQLEWRGWIADDEAASVSILRTEAISAEVNKIKFNQNQVFFAFILLKYTQQQCEFSYNEQHCNVKSPKHLTTWRDSNPRTTVLLVETMTTM